MKPSFAPAYLENLFATGDYDALVEISALLLGSQQYDSTKQDCGLGAALFAYCESLLWFAQAVRSGVATYFEATPQARQDSMLQALKAHAPTDFASMYEQGAIACRNHGSLERIDNWMQENDARNSIWLASLARLHRSEFNRIVLGA